MKTKYKEIFKLKKMLDKAGIPYEWWYDDWGLDSATIAMMKKSAPDLLLEHYHLGYPSLDEDTRWISVIEGFGTYGSDNDKLEIMGGLTPWERFAEGDGPKGYLSARNVFGRIKRNWEERQNEKENNKDR